MNSKRLNSGFCSLGSITPLEKSPDIRCLGLAAYEQTKGVFCGTRTPQGIAQMQRYRCWMFKSWTYVVEAYSARLETLPQIWPASIWAFSLSLGRFEFVLMVTLWPLNWVTAGGAHAARNSGTVKAIANFYCEAALQDNDTQIMRKAISLNHKAIRPLYELGHSAFTKEDYVKAQKLKLLE